MPSGDKQVKIKGKSHRWSKGQSGNPKGRPPKDVSLTSLLKIEIEKIPPGETKKRTWRQLLVLAWLTGAMKNPVLLKEILDRLEGKVTQPIGGEGGGPIRAQIIVQSDHAKQLAEQVLNGKGTE